MLFVKCCERMITKRQLRLMNQLRLLWEQQDVWTRETINSVAFGLPNLAVVNARLLRNPVDMARVFRDFFEEKVVARIQALFNEQLVIATELVKAIKVGDEQAAAVARRRWFENAAQLARLLEQINPFWIYGEWFELINHYLKLVESEAALLLAGNYEGNVAIYEEIEKQSMMMADKMSIGIIRKFRFR